MQIRWQYRYQRAPGKWVFVPTEESRAEGSRIKDVIENKWRPPKYYFHLRAGGHVAALRSHSNNRHFLRFDIQNFFGSVSRSRVTRCLKPLVGYEEARKIASASTVKHPHQKNVVFLPYGFVQSPVLASLALYRSALGSCLDRISKRRNLRVSVYMDDIIISSSDLDYVIAAKLEIENAAAKALFELHPEKTEGPAHKVTAFNIELTHTDLSVTQRRLYDLIQAHHHSNSKFQKDGISGYIRSVNPNQVNELI